MDRIPPPVVAEISAAVAAGQRTVLMMCGCSGSGKSTIATAVAVAFPSFVRMSIDDYVFRHHGVVDRDFPAERYESYTDEAEEANRQQLVQILHEGARDVVIDYSFYSHAARDEYRELVATEGRGRYRVVLVYLHGTEQTLWERISARQAARTKLLAEGSSELGDPNRIIPRSLLKSFVDGFDVPRGEGEITIAVE